MQKLMSNSRLFGGMFFETLLRVSNETGPKRGSFKSRDFHIFPLPTLIRSDYVFSEV